MTNPTAPDPAPNPALAAALAPLVGGAPAAPAAEGNPDPADTPPEVSEAAGDQESGQDDPPETGDDPAKRARREAKGLRDRAKAAEDQVAALTATLAAADDAMLASMLQGTSLTPELFRRAGPELAELRDEGTGLLDGALVIAAADEIRLAFGMPKVGVPLPNPGQGVPNPARAASPGQAGAISDALTESRRKRRG